MACWKKTSLFGYLSIFIPFNLHFIFDFPLPCLIAGGSTHIDPLGYPVFSDSSKQVEGLQDPGGGGEGSSNDKDFRLESTKKSDRYREWSAPLIFYLGCSTLIFICHMMSYKFIPRNGLFCSKWIRKQHSPSGF